MNVFASWPAYWKPRTSKTGYKIFGPRHCRFSVDVPTNVRFRNAAFHFGPETPRANDNAPPSIE